MAEPKAGKTINFNLVGDDLHLFNTVREIYEEEKQQDDVRVSTALEGLDPEVRALVQARLAPKPRDKELSYREVFVRALGEVLAARDAAEDARVAEELAEGVERLEVNITGIEEGGDAAEAEGDEVA